MAQNPSQRTPPPQQQEEQGNGQAVTFVGALRKQHTRSICHHRKQIGSKGYVRWTESTGKVRESTVQLTGTMMNKGAKNPSSRISQTGFASCEGGATNADNSALAAIN